MKSHAASAKGRGERPGKIPHWNEPLARLLESRLVYAVDSQQLDKTQLHCQPGLEFNLTCEGRGTLHVGSQTFPVAAGTLVFIPEPVEHRLEVLTPGRYYRSVACLAPTSGDTTPFIQALREKMRQAPFRTPRCLYLDEPSARVVRNLISRMTTETSQQAAWWQDMVLAHAYELLAFCARLSERPRPSQPPGGRLADEAAAYVASHLDGDLTSGSVAEHFGVSREHLSRIFHQHFGITYQQFVLNRRIAAARDLLAAKSASSLLDIALAVGFQSHAHFSRVFRQHEGITPTQFRTLHRQGS